jgi:Fe2+ transport system protein FeoA
MAKSGEPVRVKRLDGGEGFRSKIIALGLVPGQTVVVRSFSRRGPVVVQVNGTRVALGREMAEKVVVDAE